MLLSPRQLDVYIFLRQYIHDHGYPPTVREIGEHFGRAIFAAEGVLATLARKGFVQIDRGQSRGLRLVGPVLRLPTLPLLDGHK